MNGEIDEHKTGLIGEYLVKIRLNQYGINTGSVDKDTGTDIIMFQNNLIRTAQVKSGTKDWNCAQAHGVHVHFRVKLNCMNGNLQLDNVEIIWKRIDVPGKFFQMFSRESIGEIFQ
jgi:hypothetical protein